MPREGVTFEDDAPCGHHSAGEGDRRRVQHHDVDAVAADVSRYEVDERQFALERVHRLVEIDGHIDIAERTGATRALTAEEVGEQHARSGAHSVAEGIQPGGQLVGWRRLCRHGASIADA